MNTLQLKEVTMIAYANGSLSKENDAFANKCPYCEEPEKYGLLLAEVVEIDTHGRKTKLDYGKRRLVKSLVHKEIAGLSRLFVGVRCHLDPFHKERRAEDRGGANREANQMTEEQFTKVEIPAVSVMSPEELDTYAEADERIEATEG
jgi:hypothetical protein